MKTKHVLVALGFGVFALFPASARPDAQPGTQSAGQQSPANPPAQPQSPKTSTEKPSADKKPARKRVVADLSGFDLLGASKETMVVGATRELPRPVALAPRLGKDYGANPTFAWSYEGTAAKFIFVLADDVQAEVYRAEVSGTQVRYPADAPALQPGKIYFWTVTTPGSLLGASSSDPSGVSVLSRAQRQEIEQKLAQHPGHSYEAGVARVQVFTDYRLWYDALAALTELVERYPDRAELYEHRGTIYAQLNCTQALAMADFSRAEKAPREKQ